MRGKPSGHSEKTTRAGNIPAYAGKTPGSGCGCPGGWGTSPRMRGKRLLNRPLPAPQGNIPAYAGKTVRDPHMCFNAGEHPRVCGENLHSEKCSHNIAGTSPRMRGKRKGATLISAERRNIPAYAGKTSGPMPQSSRAPEHPRVCGENP